MARVPLAERLRGTEVCAGAQAQAQAEAQGAGRAARRAGSSRGARGRPRRGTARASPPRARSPAAAARPRSGNSAAPRSRCLQTRRDSDNTRLSNVTESSGMCRYKYVGTNRYSTLLDSIDACQPKKSAKT